MGSWGHEPWGRGHGGHAMERAEVRAGRAERACTGALFGHLLGAMGNVHGGRSWGHELEPRLGRGHGAEIKGMGSWNGAGGAGGRGGESGHGKGAWRDGVGRAGRAERAGMDWAPFKVIWGRVHGGGGCVGGGSHVGLVGAWGHAAMGNGGKGCVGGGSHVGSSMS